jgi:molybdopterin biosynthesis enzyme
MVQCVHWHKFQETQSPIMTNEHRRASPYPMVPVAAAQRLITAHSAPLPTETISSLTADGRVLSEDSFATENTPDVAKVKVDGYAPRATDGMQERRGLVEVTAGQDIEEGQQILPHGTVAWLPAALARSQMGEELEPLTGPLAGALSI